MLLDGRARWVGPDPDRQVLFLRADLNPGGWVTYTYSPRPGYVCGLTLVPGPDMPGPADQALVDAVHQIARRSRGRDD
jgi:hypothetical protein